MRPLNSLLYDCLTKEFGKVITAHEGVSAVIDYKDTSTRSRMHLVSSGEYYRVNCPYCNDKRGRLWINHLWGVQDEVLNSKNLWLAVCYNENCLASYGRPQGLFDRVYGFKNRDQRVNKIEILQGVIEDTTLKVVSAPGIILSLSELDINSTPIHYLESRGFDVKELSEIYGVGYCVNADNNYFLAHDRIFIPIVMDAQLVGWQCRYVGDLNWKESYTLKYYSCPNMPRRLMLYNYDIAKHSPFVVLCEGPMDVWNTGVFSVAAFGKHLSFNQIKLMCNTWPDAIVILLDGDAWDDTTKLIERFNQENYRGVLIPVKLPEDRDPGDIDRDLLYDFINSAALSKGIDLSTLQRTSDVGTDKDRYISSRLLRGIDRSGWVPETSATLP